MPVGSQVTERKLALQTVRWDVNVNIRLYNNWFEDCSLDQNTRHMKTIKYKRTTAKMAMPGLYVWLVMIALHRETLPKTTRT